MRTMGQPHLNEVCLEVDDLLDAYALDALEPGERAFVERHLRTCLQQQDRLVELTEVATLLGRAAPSFAAPPALWDRLAAETAPVAGLAAPAIASVPEPVAPRPVPISSRGSRASKVVTLNRWVAWGSGVAAALLLASTVALGVALQRSGDDATPKDPVVEMVARGGQVAPLSTQPQPSEITEVGQGSILTAPGMAPAVVVDHWTPSNKMLQYIVWMAAASGEQPTVLGEITIDNDGHGVLVLNGVTSFEGYHVFGISIKTTDAAGLQNVLLGQPPAQAG